MARLLKINIIRRLWFGCYNSPMVTYRCTSTGIYSRHEFTEEMLTSWDTNNHLKNRKISNLPLWLCNYMQIRVGKVFLKKNPTLYNNIITQQWNWTLFLLAYLLLLSSIDQKQWSNANVFKIKRRETRKVVSFQINYTLLTQWNSSKLLHEV